MTDQDIDVGLLQAIWDKHGLGVVTNAVKPTRGMVNRAFVVNDSHVIRFDLLDDWPDLVRYAGEQWAYDMLRGSDVPVPEVVALDSSKTLVPNDYIILTKMPGRTINEMRDSLTAADNQTIGYAAGQYLATMHNIAFDGFGLLFKLAAGQGDADWAAFITNFYADYSGQVRRNGWLPEETLERIAAVQARMQPLLAGVTQGRFVHGDYHFSNILQADGQITAVLDFEWAMSGDPTWDFRIDDQLEEACPGSKGAFYTGYTSRRALSENHAEKVAFYKLGLYLDYLTFLDDERDETIRVLMKELTWLEANLP